MNLQLFGNRIRPGVNLGRKWRRVIGVSTGILLFIIICTLLGLWFSKKPDLYPHSEYSQVLLDAKGNIIRITLAADDRYRVYVPIEKISKDLIKATILYEDKHYYRHSGVDIKALFRAIWSTYIIHSHRVGASTIPMQVARLRWQLSTRNLSGKLFQIIRALQLSRHYSKDDLLEAYFNLAPYGQNVEGVGAASLVYFGKEASRLTWPEAITLSVVPQNPNARAPAVERNKTALNQAKARLLERWLEKYPGDRNKRVMLGQL